MDLEKAGKYISFFVEMLEILVTGKLTSAILKLSQLKNIKHATSTGSPVSGTTSGPGPTQGAEQKAPHHRFAGLGPEDNMLRESVLLKLVVSRQNIYREFEAWLLKEHVFEWAAFMHYLTVQTEKDPKDAQSTMESVVEIVKPNTIDSKEAGLKYVRYLTKEVIAELIKAYWKLSKNIFDAFLRKWPELKNQLTQAMIKLDCRLGELGDGLQKVIDGRRANRKKKGWARCRQIMFKIFVF